MTTTRESQSIEHAGQTARGFFAVWLVVLVLAVYPYSVLPTVDIKWLAIGMGGPAAMLVAIVTARADFVAVLRGAPGGIVLLALTGWLLLAAAFAQNTGVALLEVSRLAAYAMLYLAAASVFHTPQQLQRLLVVFCVAMAAASLYGFVQLWGYDPLPWDATLLQTEEYRHLPATLGNPNVAGHALVLTLIAASCLAMTRWRRWAALVIAICFMHLLLTRHRAGVAALVGAVALGIIALGMARRRRTQPVRAALLAGVLWVALGAAGLGVLCCAHFAVRGVWVPREQSLVQRFNSFFGCARMTSARPATGFGPGNYEIASPPYWTEYERDHYAREGRYNAHPHNEYLNLAVEGGLVAPALYIFLLAFLIVRGLATHFSTVEPGIRWTGLLGALAFSAYAIDGMFGFNWRAPVSGAAAMVIAGACEGVLFKFRAVPHAARFAQRFTWGLSAAIAVPVAVLAAAAFLSQRDLLRARGAMAWSQPDASLSQLNHAALCAPWNWALPSEAGRIELARGNVQAAATAYARALQLHPNYLPALCGIARAELVRAGVSDEGERKAAFDRASDAMRKIDAIDPGLPELPEFRGTVALLRAGEVPVAERAALKREAIDCYLRAVAAGVPDRARLLHAAAMTAADLGDDNAALRYLELGLASARVPDYVLDTYLAAGTRLNALGSVVNALEKHSRQVAADPASIPEDRALALAYFAEARARTGAGADITLPIFESAVAADPACARAWELFYARARQGGNSPRFVTAFTTNIPKAIAAGANLPFSCRAAAAALLSTPPNPRGGMEVLASALTSTDPYRATASDARLGWVAQLVRELLASQAVAPDFGTQFNAGILLARTACYADALVLFDSLATRTPPEAAAQMFVERIYALLGAGRAADAERVTREALGRFPGDAELGLALPRSLARQHHVDEARLEYTLLQSRIVPGSPIDVRIREDLRELDHVNHAAEARPGPA